MSLPSPETVVTLAVAGLIVALALGFLAARRTFYSILMLALIGAAVAAAMALLGYTYLAVFHLAMYVGAAVAFLLFTMATVGEDVREVSIRHSVAAAVAAAAVAAAIVAPFALAYGLGEAKPLPTTVWNELSGYVLRENWLTMLVAVVAIASILVEVVAVARRG